MSKACNFIDYPKVLVVKVLAFLCFNPKALIFMYVHEVSRIKVEALWFILCKGGSFMYDTSPSMLKMLALW
jgi:hypothetical protein